MSSFYFLTRKITYITLGAINRLLPQPTLPLFLLSYHSIDSDGWAFSVSKNEYEKQIAFLSKICTFISLSDLNEYLDGKKSFSKPSVVITFDDGYKNILRVRSLMKSRNIRPTVFILSDPDNADRQQLGNEKEFLSNKDILDLAQDGWEIGCHTATHQNLFQLDNETMKREILDSKLKLEKSLKIPIKYFAYPKGRYNKAILKAVTTSDYKLAVTMDDGLITPDSNALSIPRIGVDGTHTFAEFTVLFSPLVSKARGLMKALGYGK